MALKSRFLTPGFSKHFTESPSCFLGIPGNRGDSQVSHWGFVKIPPSPSAWLLRVSDSPGQPQGGGLAGNTGCREVKVPAERGAGDQTRPGCRTPSPPSASPAFTAPPAPSSAPWGRAFVLNPAEPTLVERREAALQTLEVSRAGRKRKWAPRPALPCCSGTTRAWISLRCSWPWDGKNWEPPVPAPHPPAFPQPSTRH